MPILSDGSWATDSRARPSCVVRSIWAGTRSDQFGAIVELDPRRFPGFELWHMDARHVGLEFDFIVDHDAE